MSDRSRRVRTEAQEHPLGAARTAHLQRRSAEATAAGELVEAAVYDLETVWQADQAGDLVTAMTTYADVRARVDGDPARYEEVQWTLDWQAKWMPTQALQHPGVPLARIDALIDDVERRHRAAGAGGRPAEALRMARAREVGALDDLAAALAAWRSVPRSGMSDCAACEIRDEAAGVLALGGEGAAMEALAVLEPLVSGSIRPCSDNAATMLCRPVPLLLASGRIDDARRLHGMAARRAVGAGLAGLRGLSEVGAVSAAAGRPAEGVRLLLLALGLVGLNHSPDGELACCTAGVAILAAAADDDATLLLEGSLPPWLADRPRRIRAGDLAAALDERAVALAALFDHRNGTTRHTDLLAAARRPAPLPPLDPAGPAPAAAVPAAPTPALPPPVAASPAPPVGETGAWMAWLFEQQDAGRSAAVEEVARRVLADGGATATERALAVLAAALEDERDRVGLADVSEAIRLRLEAWARHAAAGPADPTAVDDLVERADRLWARQPDLAAAAALRAVLAASVEHALVAGDTAVTLAALSRMAGDDALLVHPVVDLHRWGVVAAGWHALLSSGAAVDRDRAAAAVTSATAVVVGASDRWPGTAAGAALPLAQLAMGLGLAEPAAALEAVLAPAAAGDVGPAELRGRSALVLSDLRSRRGDLAGALAAQRHAVTAAARHEGPAQVAWARRGQAGLLRAMGRLDEAAVVYADAAALAEEADAPALAAELLVERSGVEAALGDGRSAAASARRATATLAAVPDGQLHWRALLAEADVTGDDLAAADLYQAAAERQLAAGRSPALARSAGARSLASADEVDEARARFALALDEVDLTPEGPERCWNRAVVRSRRAEAFAADIEASAADAAAAATDFLAADRPVMAARAHRTRARLLRAAGDADGVAAALQAALELARAAGDEGLAEALAAEQAQGPA